MAIKEKLNFIKSTTLWDEQSKPKEMRIHLRETNRTLKIPTPKRPYQAYTAGPLFTPLQRKMIEEIASLAASKRVVPYIPHVHSGEVALTGSKWKESIFRMDVKGIDTSDLLIMWADYGFEPDPGTVWEQGRAYALNKPIIALREDFRNWSRRRGRDVEESVMNLMMEESVDIVARNLDELGRAIEEVIQYLDKKR